MTTAFQSNAFQNNAFQIDEAVIADRRGGRYRWEERLYELGGKAGKKRKRVLKVIEQAEEAIAEVDNTPALVEAIAALDDKIEALVEAQTKAEINACIKAVQISTAALIAQAEEAEEEDAILFLM